MRAAQKACLHIPQNHSYCEHKQKLGSNTVVTSQRTQQLPQAGP